MKSKWMLATALAVFALLATACEEQKKEAEERGKIPQELVNKAKEAEQKVKLLTEQDGEAVATAFEGTDHNGDTDKQ